MVNGHVHSGCKYSEGSLLMVRGQLGGTGMAQCFGVKIQKFIDAYGMMKDMEENPKNWEGRKVHFLHTGRLLGLFDKADQMSSLPENPLVQVRIVESDKKSNPA
ncbi:hypothetical protein Peur_031792 [Populus x canadensis]